MFYYPAVLKRHSGCFSTIWLVATKGIKVPRRDFLKVNIKNTCDDIMNYLLERVSPPQPGLPRPRFSLYLSSQLQYGVIMVYHRQCAILLEEIQFVVNRLLKSRTSQKIDIDDSRQPLVLSDALSLMENAEGAPDPFFGVMYMQDTIPSPSALTQMSREYPRETSPESPELSSSAESGITASQDSITLREMEPVVFPAPEFEGAELDDHPEIVDLLLAQTDHFPEGDSEIPREDVTPEEHEREIERERRERDLEKERPKEPTGSLTDLQPTMISGEDATLLPQEEPGPPEEMPGPPKDLLTPILMPGIPSPPSVAEERKIRPRSPELEDLPPSEVTMKRRRRRRRRQLIFFDPETQISEEELQQRISDPVFETRRPFLPLPFPHRIPPAAELFNNPCNFLPEDVLFLWRQASTITPVSSLDLQVGEWGPAPTDSERESERGMMAVAEREEERPELGPEEALKEAAEAEMLEISAQGTLPLEGSDQREVSREISPGYISDREGSTVSRSVSILQDIPEAVGELPVAAEPLGLLPELAEHEEIPVLFHSLLPLEVDRRTVSNIFQRLLENLSAKKVRAEQDEPYGDILISPGAFYEVVHQAS